MSDQIYSSEQNVRQIRGAYKIAIFCKISQHHIAKQSVYISLPKQCRQYAVTFLLK